MVDESVNLLSLERPALSREERANAADRLFAFLGRERRPVEVSHRRIPRAHPQQDSARPSLIQRGNGPRGDGQMPRNRVRHAGSKPDPPGSLGAQRQRDIDVPKQAL